MSRTFRAVVLCAAAGAILSWSNAARASDDELVLDLGEGTLDLVRIPSGTFVQGSPSTEVGREPDEGQRTVKISRSFWLGKVPVTRAQYARFVGETRYLTEAEKGQSGGTGWDGKALVQRKDFNWRNPGFAQKDEDPVVLVTFGDANAFTAWVSRKTGRKTRLPTEAEYEYATRGGTSTPWYGATKEEDALALGWFKANASSSTHPVGRKKANAFGLFDMSGNVFEWCRDVYAPYPAGDAVDPENTASTTAEPERRVLRGGSWLREPRRGRSAARFRNTPGSRNADNGFRVAVDDDGGAGSPPGAGQGSELSPSPSSSTSTFAPAASSSSSPGAERARPATEGMAWALVAGPVGAAAAVVAWMLARRKSGRTNERGISTRSGTDGFWVRAPHLPVATRVRYTCSVRGVEVSDVVPLDGAQETFVYTGGEPSAIRIDEVVAAPAAGYRAPQAPQAPRGSVPRQPSSSADPYPPTTPLIVHQIHHHHDASSSSSSSDDSSFAGYPSAY